MIIICICIAPFARGYKAQNHCAFWCVWIRLITAHLLFARKVWQINALALNLDVYLNDLNLLPWSITHIKISGWVHWVCLISLRPKKKKFVSASFGKKAMCCAFFFTKLSYALCDFFLIELSPHATPTHFHFSTLSFYEIVCKFSIPCHKFPTLFVEKLLLLRQFDNCND